MSRQFKNRKAVDPYGKDYSQIPDEIQWGDMMISKEANPQAWEQYANKIKAGQKSPKGYPTQSPPTQRRPLRTVPEGTIREPLFGRNPDGSPKPRPRGMDSEEVAALAAAQERKYNPPQKATKKTSNSASAKPARTPPGVIGYDALNQPVYGRRPTAPESLVRQLQVQAMRGDSNAARNLANINRAEQLGYIPKTEKILPAGSVFSGSYDRNGDPIYGIPVPGMKANVPKGQPLNREQAKAQQAALMQLAQKANKLPGASGQDQQPFRDMQGNPVKLDDMFISGGIGRSAESKKQSMEAKRKPAQAISSTEAGQARGSFRVINGQVRFFGGGADAAKEVETVKPTGMR
jgi:hypothetical protein